MQFLTIHIKNMVCPRCIKVVREELEKINLQVVAIDLGKVEVSSAAPIDLSKVKNILEQNGFGLIEDKSVKIIEEIKSYIIELIHHPKEKVQHENYSDLISKKLAKDYHFLSNLFSTHENITIEKYIILQKIERVKELLIYDELSISEISYQLGYSSVAYLSNQFKQHTGFTPSEFKKLKSHKRNSIDQIGGL